MNTDKRMTPERRKQKREADNRYIKTEKGKRAVRRNILNYKKRHKEKNAARCKLQYHVRVGNVIKPDVCSVNDDNCDGAIHAHHDDYSKPLDVRWLCKNHHNEVHHGFIST